VDPNTELVLIANQFVPQPETVALSLLALSGPIDQKGNIERADNEIVPSRT